MNDIFQKISIQDEKQVFDAILKNYETKGFAIVQYLYFANIIINGILGKKTPNTAYIDALKAGDFLLPDGIALQKYYKKYFKKNISNLNGTDFIEYVLSHIGEYNLIFYGATQKTIHQVVKKLPEKRRKNLIYFQDGYSDFDWKKLEKILKNSLNKKNIFLVGLGTPKQEIWINQNRENIKKYHLLTFAQGGTFDFWSGKNKRAPKLIQKLKLEWIWRVILNPKKNFKKVYYSFKLFGYLWKKEEK